VMDAAGGGGYGNPLDREPELLEWDVLEGYVSVEGARRDYGVVVDPGTMKVDIDATLALRGAMVKAS
jgi:N-methylhydantoinase B